jgi:hypothetical protein
VLPAARPDTQEAGSGRQQGQARHAEPRPCWATRAHNPYPVTTCTGGTRGLVVVVVGGTVVVVVGAIVVVVAGRAVVIGPQGPR